jgi:ABC-type branched-subunit amino acid transport system ATPase component
MGDPAQVHASNESAESALRVERLTIRYGGVTAVDDLSLDVAPGAVHGLIGPNGAGKSSVVEAVSGFVAPQQGTVYIAGRDVTGLSPHRRARQGLGRSFQHLELFDDLTVRENLAAAARGARREVEGALDVGADFLGNPSYLDRQVSDLTHGQRRLVSVARVLAMQPSIIVLDEPASGLDTAESTHLARRLTKVAANETAILLIDHDMSFVFDVCTEISVLNFGRLLASGLPDAVRSDPEVRKAYLGS